MKRGNGRVRNLGAWARSPFSDFLSSHQKARGRNSRRIEKRRQGRRELLLVEPLLPHSISFKPHNKQSRVDIVALVSGDSKRLNNLSKVTQFIRGGVQVHTHMDLSDNTSPFFPLPHSAHSGKWQPSETDSIVLIALQSRLVSAAELLYRQG